MQQDTTIAIIDDDASVRAAISSLIRSLGFTATTFATAEEFLQSPRLRDSRCVITDLQMSGMTGLELQSRLQADGHRLPLIFITAFAEERIRRQAMAAGAVGFLSKPFDGSDMIACIDEALAASA